MTHYAAGVVKKSKREKEQEAAEAKKKEEEADAARAYAEFLDAFEGDGRKANAAFVKAGQPGPSRPDVPKASHAFNRVRQTYCSHSQNSSLVPVTISAYSCCETQGQTSNGLFP